MRKILKYMDIVLLSILLAGALVFRYVPGTGEFYAMHLYPAISTALSALSCVLPFSLDEWAVVFMAVFLIAWPVMAKRRGRTWKCIVLREIEWILWIYVWFYWGWGLNYYRDSFYSRAGVRPAEYREDAFRAFLDNYADSLNSAFLQSLPDGYDAPEDSVRGEIKSLFRKVPEHYGLTIPKGYQTPKYTCFNFLYSSVGVLGYMGPFFAESHLNRELSRLEYPFTYAHELSHLLGIGSEAEANFWAYTVCTASSDPAIRYSGFFGIFPYVISNARNLLGREECSSWLSTVDIRIVGQLGDRQRFWSTRYSPFIGKIQESMYEMYLKGNRISSGQKNYAEVVLLLLSVEDSM